MEPRGQQRQQQLQHQNMLAVGRQQDTGLARMPSPLPNVGPAGRTCSGGSSVIRNLGQGPLPQLLSKQPQPYTPQQHQPQHHHQVHAVDCQAPATVAGVDWLNRQLADMQRLRQNLMQHRAAAEGDIGDIHEAQRHIDCGETDQSDRDSVTRVQTEPRDSLLHKVCSRQLIRQDEPSPCYRSDSPGSSCSSVASRECSEVDGGSLAKCFDQANNNDCIASPMAEWELQFQGPGSATDRGRTLDSETNTFAAYYPAGNRQSSAAPQTPTNGGRSTLASIEAMYSNFLAVSQKLNGMIAEYLVSAAAAGQQQQPLPTQLPQLPTPPQPPQRKPALILPSPIRRSLESSRRQPLPSEPQATAPPPKTFAPDKLLNPQQHQQQQQQQQQQQSKHQQKKRGKKATTSKTAKRERQQQQQQEQQRAGDSGRTAGGLGLGRRIRDSLCRLSPRLRTTPPLPPINNTCKSPPQQLAQLPETAAAAATSAAAAAAAAAAAVTEASRNSSGGGGEVASPAVTLNTPVPLALLADCRSQPPADAADPCLQKLQRLRSTVLGLVQRSVDPVLQSLRDIQHRRGDPEVDGRRSSSAVNLTEVTASLRDVMSLMELLSRSVMLVSMHNLDPNSLKLVYLSSSYIRSLKRLAKSLSDDTQQQPQQPQD